ncbi:MAG: Hpt domain-containing protein [Betaproteobacteria bacterium]|nr:Hpt domain-containing protein [Betaproteobacteria bacterium]
MSKSGTPASQSSAGDFDLTQFYQVFFEEAAENLASMENMLLAIDVDDPVEEDLHAIFRAAHSIKGGAATFGFQDVAELTHELETMLDRVRKHEIPLTTEIVDTLLEAGDVLKAQLARHQAGDTGEVGDISEPAGDRAQTCRRRHRNRELRRSCHGNRFGKACQCLQHRSAWQHGKTH